MVKAYLILLFIIVSQSLSAQEKKESIEVCETCGQKLETYLYYVRGIKLVTYNEEAQTTTVIYKPQLITPDKIRHEIAKLGFDADQVPADPKGYAQRDGCCKPD